ncbi:uncharacterized protein LOC132198088 [Neocloeon triangulifer]|uniref:uncharacterized protein LOC132198088 n=1 Tax=Neocloeon triangulifer TaxID=2078957 RepID=UPI00286F7E30|nr:uncharacterized protein LOC132198088 [Neocloeon triangulifer]XP_059477960.1 uncharacterized protein LOC132198088 [Neocloeon triangulifer]
MRGKLLLHVALLPRFILIPPVKSFSSRTMASHQKIICLFDVDGTLTAPRKVITKEMETFLFEKVKSKCDIGLVGGSDLSKIAEQTGGPKIVNKCNFLFAENGLVAYKNGNQVGCESIQHYVGEEKLQRFINFSLRYMSEIELPVKRGTFIEFRNGLINVCPVGRSCSQAERDQFAEYDAVHNIRKKFVEALRAQFSDLGLAYSIGGQISFDVFPEGWDKTYCLKYIVPEKYDEIHFFGDKTDAGGNDHEIYNHEKVIGHKVTSPDDTKNQLSELFNIV